MNIIRNCSKYSFRILFVIAVFTFLFPKWDIRALNSERYGLGLGLHGLPSTAIDHFHLAIVKLECYGHCIPLDGDPAFGLGDFLCFIG